MKNWRKLIETSNKNRWTKRSSKDIDIHDTGDDLAKIPL